MEYQYMATTKRLNGIKYPEKCLKPTPPDVHWELVSTCNVKDQYIMYFWKSKLVRAS